MNSSKPTSPHKPACTLGPIGPYKPASHDGLITPLRHARPVELINLRGLGSPSRSSIPSGLNSPSKIDSPHGPGEPISTRELGSQGKNGDPPSLTSSKGQRTKTSRVARLGIRGWASTSIVSRLHVDNM